MSTSGWAVRSHVAAVKDGQLLTKPPAAAAARTTQHMRAARGRHRSLVTHHRGDACEPTHAQRIRSGRSRRFTAWHRQARHATERAKKKKKCHCTETRSNHHHCTAPHTPLFLVPSFILDLDPGIPLGNRRLTATTTTSKQLPNRSYKPSDLSLHDHILFSCQCNVNRCVKLGASIYIFRVVVTSLLLFSFFLCVW